MDACGISAARICGIVLIRISVSIRKAHPGPVSVTSHRDQEHVALVSMHPMSRIDRFAALPGKYPFHWTPSRLGVALHVSGYASQLSDLQAVTLIRWAIFECVHENNFIIMLDCIEMDIHYRFTLFGQRG